MTTHAYSYIRFSTKSQIKGDSLERQLSKAREYSRKNHLLLDEVSYQDLGISAFKGKNATEGALKAFLDGVEQGAIKPGSMLLIENFDRLSRAQVTNALQLFLSITNRGISIVTLCDGVVYNKDTINANWTQLIITLATMARAHEESAIKSFRVKSGKKAALEAGRKHGKCPFWLKVNEKKNGFLVIEEKANIVKEAFSMKLNGIGALRIAKSLNEKYGFKWGAPQVARLLTNKSVIGVRVSQAGYEPLENYYPSIINENIFYQVSALMNSPSLGTRRGRRTEDEANLFTGLLRCWHCGASMRFFRESKSVKQRYIRCNNSLSRAGCDVSGVNYEFFEKEFLAALFLDQDETLVEIRDSRKELNLPTDAEVKELKDQYVRLIDWVAEGKINSEVATQRIKDLDLKIKEKQLQIELAKESKFKDIDFPIKGWGLMENLYDANLNGDRDRIIELRREIKMILTRSISCVRVHQEDRSGDTYYGVFKIEFSDFENYLKINYERPALNAIKGVWNN